VFGDRWRVFKFSYEGDVPAEKLVNPLPQVHPIEVCVSIHNRDANSCPIDISFADFVRCLPQQESL
jgi:hypothetical protein